MQPKQLRRLFTLPLFAGMAVMTGQAVAADFYAGKTITIITSTGAGGSFDAAARSISRFMPNYLPGKPNMIVRNMPGGGHTRATNYMYNQAPKDGTTIATVGYTIPMHQVTSGRGVRYDASKFNWLGTVGISNLAMMVWHTAGVKSIADLKNKEVTTGATGTGSATYLYANALNRVLGTKYKIITGYRKSVDIDIAMERGEVAGRGGQGWTSVPADHPDWIKEKKIIVLAQVGRNRLPELKDVPLLQELTDDKDKKEILRFISLPVGVGRGFLAPPGVPTDRVALLRSAFDKTMKDKGFIEETNKLQLDIRYTPGEELAKIVDETVNAPKELIAKVKDAIIVPADELAREKERRQNRAKKKKE
ncbi:MAG: tripartite tricarboxylate transporter substrate-binding protein [Beijerinckiaceae bacterium]|nr:tripartite tricarboxylate transporter substrate-binding protein [Beijerinckiaceae bacterium]